MTTFEKTYIIEVSVSRNLINLLLYRSLFTKYRQIIGECDSNKLLFAAYVGSRIGQKSQKMYNTSDEL